LVATSTLAVGELVYSWEDLATLKQEPAHMEVSCPITIPGSFRY